MAKAKGKPGSAAAGGSGNQPSEVEPRVSFYPAWCKHCGNCVAFCPRGALAKDEWGAPYLKNPERCTACGLCEMLCPDFAITVGEAAAPEVAAKAAGGDADARERPRVPVSPERLAPGPRPEDH